MPHETRFVRPPEALLPTLVEAALRSAGRRSAPVVWAEHGSHTLVALTDDVAVRVTRQPHAADDLLRAQRLVDALPPLPFAVPRSVGDAVEREGYLAVPVQRLPGTPEAPTRPDPAVLRDLLDAVHAVPLAPLTAHLAAPRAFCGGDAWQQVLHDRVVPLLPTDVRDEAARRVSALAALDAVEPVLNHGDLAGSNLHWQDGRVVGVLDWDLAAPDDPAEDVAALATSLAAWDVLVGVLDAGTLRRARVFARTFPLQVVGYGLLQRRPSAEVQRLVERAGRALRAEPSV